MLYPGLIYIPHPFIQYEQMGVVPVTEQYHRIHKRFHHQLLQ